jgi:hypothetical protein
MSRAGSGALHFVFSPCLGVVDARRRGSLTVVTTVTTVEKVRVLPPAQEPLQGRAKDALNGKPSVHNSIFLGPRTNSETQTTETSTSSERDPKPEHSETSLTSGQTASAAWVVFRLRRFQVGVLFQLESLRRVHSILKFTNKWSI